MKKTVRLLILLAFLVACAKNDVAEENGTYATAETIAPAITLSESDEAVTATPLPTIPNDIENENDDSFTSSTDIAETITIQFAVQEFESVYYRDLIQVFEAENPHISVKLTFINEVLSESSAESTALQLAQAVDVFSSIYAPPESHVGIVRDLTPFINADLSFGATDFYPNTLQRQDGQLFVLPTSVQFSLIFYNRALFDAANVAYPEPGWTWDAFREAANALTIRNGNQVVQYGFVKPIPSWVSLIEGRLTERLIDTNRSPAVLRFQDDDVQAVVQSYVNLAQEDSAAIYANQFDPSIESLFGSYPESLLIENNQAAMWPELYSSAVPLDETYTLDWGVVPYPSSSSDAPSTLILPTGLVMSAGTAFPDAAWQWMTFLSRLNPSSFFGNDLPARISVAEASGYWDGLTPEMREAMQYALDHSYNIDTFSAYAPLGGAMQAILAGEKSVDEALADAQIAAETILAETAAAQPPDAFTVAQDTGSNEGFATFDFIVFNGIDLERYQTLAEAFAQDNSALQVQVNILSRSSSGGFSDSAANSDCFQWSAITFEPDYRLMVLSLDPLLDADSDFSLSDFYPFLLEQFRSQGQLWGLPISMQPTLIEYNKALFDEANLPYPPLTWTPEEFLQTAVSLTRQIDGETEQYGFVVDAFENTFLLEMVVRLGAQLIDDSQTPPTLLLNDPEMIETMRWYTDLSLVYQAKPAYGIGPFDDIDARQQLIVQEQAAMWTTLGADVGVSIDGRDSLQIGVTPLPIQSGVTATLSPASGLYISANATDVRGCWEWMKFLTAQPTLTTGVPARISVAESAVYAQSIGEERATANLGSINNITESTAFRLYATENSWLSRGIPWLQQAYTEIMDGDATVEQALDAVQQRFDAYRACIIERNGFTDDEVQNQCVTEGNTN
ncbi:hypothetical protein MNBD_CHLOROFLEXI01-3599 [hydrothermal vent metagenome]|uniref:Extracellular solute-binding protein n=1 Tax=hydrothermal vent metagenome TaxID=652676 RepID=A0A3B0VJ58_9ZZZZ